MKNAKESIQIWTSKKAPECYRRFFPAASELDWIAVVHPSAMSEFGHQLCANGYLDGINIIQHALSDGTWTFCGRERLELQDEK